MLLDLVRRDVEALDQVGSVDNRLVALPAAVEQVCEQCLEHGEPFRRNRPRDPLELVPHARLRLRGELLGRSLMPVTDEAQCSGDLPPQLWRRDGRGPPVLTSDPGSELPRARIFGHEEAVFDAAVLPVRPLDPPGRVVGDLDARLAGDVADLPRRAVAVGLELEIRREAEVPLPARRETDVAADSRDAEGADVLTHEVLADDVPGAVVLKQGVRVERPLLLGIARDRPVVELDRALLRDRALELAEAPREFGRVLRIEHLDAQGRVCRGLGESRAPQCEVLQRQTEWLRVGELALEQVERRLEGGQLVVLEIELGEKVGLRAHRVQLLAGVLVALGVERHAQPDQLGPVGVEPARKRLVRHLLVALDVALDIPRSHGPPLGHQEGDEGELADQLVRVMTHEPRELLRIFRGVRLDFASLVARDTLAPSLSEKGSSGSYSRAGLEVLVRGAVVAVRQRGALTRLALPRRCAAASDAAV